MKLKFLSLLLLLTACGKEKISLPFFSEIKMPVSEDLSAVWFSDGQHGAVSGGKAWTSGFLLSTADGGESWNIDTSLNRKMEHVTFSPGGQAYACGQDMILYRPPQALQWQPFRRDFQWLHSAHFPGEQYGAVVSGEGYHGGQLQVFGPDAFWQLDTLHEVLGEMEAVWYADSTTILAVGTGWVIRSIDAGRSWERLKLTGDFFTSVHFPDQHTGYICGNSGSILKTDDGGKNWRTIRKGAITGPRNKGFRALWFSSPQLGWIVGDAGVFMHSSNGGECWQQVAEAPRDADYTDVFVLDGKGWATAKDGRFFVFEK